MFDILFDLLQLARKWKKWIPEFGLICFRISSLAAIPGWKKYPPSGADQA